MVEVVWSEPALADLDAVADYIALENPQAAKNLVARVFQHADQLEHHPESGRKVRELRGSGYREVIEPPCRVIYRYNKSAAKRSFSMSSAASGSFVGVSCSPRFKVKPDR